MSANHIMIALGVVSLIPRPHLDFILQPQVCDKIWKWLGTKLYSGHMIHGVQ